MTVLRQWEPYRSCSVGRGRPMTLSAILVTLWVTLNWQTLSWQTAVTLTAQTNIQRAEYDMQSRGAAEAEKLLISPLMTCYSRAALHHTAWKTAWKKIKRKNSPSITSTKQNRKVGCVRLANKFLRGTSAIFPFVSLLLPICMSILLPPPVLHKTDGSSFLVRASAERPAAALWVSPFLQRRQGRMGRITLFLFISLFLGMFWFWNVHLLLFFSQLKLTCWHSRPSNPLKALRSSCSRLSSLQMLQKCVPSPL